MRKIHSPPPTPSPQKGLGSLPELFHFGRKGCCLGGGGEGRGDLFPKGASLLTAFPSNVKIEGWGGGSGNSPAEATKGGSNMQESLGREARGGERKADLRSGHGLPSFSPPPRTPLPGRFLAPKGSCEGPQCGALKSPACQEETPEWQHRPTSQGCCCCCFGRRGGNPTEATSLHTHTHTQKAGNDGSFFFPPAGSRSLPGAAPAGGGGRNSVTPGSSARLTGRPLARRTAVLFRFRPRLKVAPSLGGGGVRRP